MYSTHSTLVYILNQMLSLMTYKSILHSRCIVSMQLDVHDLSNKACIPSLGYLPLGPQQKVYYPFLLILIAWPAFRGLD